MDTRTVMLMIAFAVAGGLAAWAYCLLLRRSLADLTGEKGRAGRFIVFLLLRLAMVAALFYAALQFGTWTLVAHLAGFFVVRYMVLARTRSALVSDTRHPAKPADKIDQLNT